MNKKVNNNLNQNNNNKKYKNKNNKFLFITGIRGIQDARQTVDGKTKDIENNDKKGLSRFLSIRQLMKKRI